MHREYHYWHSPHLGRDMELLIFGQSGARVIVFPTRAGRFYDYENWGLINAVRDKIDNGWLQFICIDSIDAESFYCDWCPPRDRIIRHQQYEHYILHEVIPFTLERNPDTYLIAHGCSMGAYHAVNIAMRHPALFSRVIALSGRYDLTRGVGSFRDLFDGYYDEDVYFHNPSHFISNISDHELLDTMRRIEMTIVIGEEDSFLENNLQFRDALTNKGITPSFHIWSGEAHRPRYWREMITTVF
ncbi:MAG: esterase [Desulfuromonadales bacterium]|nr:MAG: esterase [Desulfuromonadales bacterium]